MKTYIGGEIISPAFRLSETAKYQIKTAIQVLMKRAQDGDLSAYDDVSSLVESLDSGWCQVIDSLQGQLTDHAMVCTAHRAFLDETGAAPQQPPATVPEPLPERLSMAEFSSNIEAAGWKATHPFEVDLDLPLGAKCWTRGDGESLAIYERDGETVYMHTSREAPQADYAVSQNMGSLRLVMEAACTPELASAETVQQITEEYRRDPSSFGFGVTRKRS